MSTKEKMEVLVPEKHEVQVEKKEPKNKSEDLYGEQKTGDPIEPAKPFVPKSQANKGGSGAVIPNKK